MHTCSFWWSFIRLSQRRFLQQIDLVGVCVWLLLSSVCLPLWWSRNTDCVCLLQLCCCPLPPGQLSAILLAGICEIPSSPKEGNAHVVEMTMAWHMDCRLIPHWGTTHNPNSNQCAAIQREEWPHKRNRWTYLKQEFMCFFKVKCTTGIRVVFFFGCLSFFLCLCFLLGKQRISVIDHREEHLSIIIIMMIVYFNIGHFNKSVKTRSNYRPAFVQQQQCVDTQLSWQKRRLAI